MQEAWKEVSNAKSPTNWALFGYEGKSFDLKLVSKGEDGLEELKEDLNASKIMYAFLRVEDPKTSLPKYVFLHWQGETVPGTRKGLSATHLRDIQKYFHGSHLTVNARNEDEVDEDDIILKVSKVSSSEYNFKEKQSFDNDQPKPVGSTHKKINPKAELPDLDAREKFWSSEENKEKERIALEKDRKKSEAKQIEGERRKREEHEANLREAAIKERERKISQIKDAEAKSLNNEKESQKKWEEQQMQDVKDEAARQNRAEELRKQRSAEAKSLIGQRSTEARAVFERNSSMGQMNFRKPSLPSAPEVVASTVVVATPAPTPKEIVVEKPQSKPVEATAVQETPKEQPVVVDQQKEINANEVSTEDNIVPPPAIFGNDDNRVEVQPDVTGAAAGPTQPDLIQDVAAKQGPDVTSTAREADAEPEKNIEVNGGTAGGASSEYGLCAMALYDYQAADDTEISFDPGQVITHIDQIDPGWWQGLGPDGNYGLFPANYVEVIDPSSIKSQ